MFLRLLLATFWLVAPIASQVHDLVVAHVVCDEHGERMEANSATTAADGISADHDEDHEHGCGFPAVSAPVSIADGSAVPVPRVDHAAPTPTFTTRSARAPPLSFAPKTSPPVSA